MRIAVLYHVSFETLGYIEDWIQNHGHSVSHYRLFDNPRIPVPDTFDMLIMMGGPMSVNDENQFPWLIPEKELIRKCAASGKSVLGICLGAQMIASALGKKVYPGAYREIGWFPVTFTDHASRVGGLSGTLPLFHWHGETFDLPDGAIHIALSEAVPNQAFLYRNHILALQFHPEMKPENISVMVNMMGDELVQAPFVQDAETLLGGLDHIPAANALMDRILDYLEGCSHTRAK
jgi:GMP synthase-like glutamine amidotransferase